MRHIFLVSYRYLFEFIFYIISLLFLLFIISFFMPFSFNIFATNVLCHEVENSEIGFNGI